MQSVNTITEQLHSFQRLTTLSDVMCRGHKAPTDVHTLGALFPALIGDNSKNLTSLDGLPLEEEVTLLLSHTWDLPNLIDFTIPFRTEDLEETRLDLENLRTFRKLEALTLCFDPRSQLVVEGLRIVGQALQRDDFLPNLTLLNLANVPLGRDDAESREVIAHLQGVCDARGMDDRWYEEEDQTKESSRGTD